MNSKKDPESHSRYSTMKKGAKTRSGSKRLGGGEKWLKKRGKKSSRN